MSPRDQTVVPKMFFNICNKFQSVTSHVFQYLPVQYFIKSGNKFYERRRQVVECLLIRHYRNLVLERVLAMTFLRGTNNENWSFEQVN